MCFIRKQHSQLRSDIERERNCREQGGRRREAAYSGMSNKRKVDLTTAYRGA